MSSFCVWAPKPKTVLLRIDGKDYPMRRDDSGWWEADYPAAPGTEYQYLIDGDALPDPRSPSQPHGVHGPSATVDHAAFTWTDAHWQAPPLSSAIVYELHIGTFTPEGTFESAIARLDHLVELGITHVELMPVAEFGGSHGWGYDGVDLFAPHHIYGCPEGLKRLVDACHARGLAVLLDVVYNHLGPSGNYLARFGPWYTDRHVTLWGPALNLDGPESHEVRRFLCDNALMWLRDYHFDGLRLDAVHALLDTSAVHLLEQLAEEVARLEAQLGRNLVLIAESDLNDPRVVRPREIGGYGIDAQWSDDFHHSLHTVLTGERNGYYADFGSIEQLARSLREAFVYAGDFSCYRGRPHGRRTEGLPGWRFLGYLQNHDQIGNRALGERASRLMSRGKLMIGAALVMTAPFIPMLFQGEEWAASTPFLYFTQHEEDWLKRAVSEGRRRDFAAFGWRAEDVPDPEDPATFARSKLDWDEAATEPHASMLAWHRELIRLRRAHPELTDGRMDRVRTQFDEDKRWLLLRRGSFTIASNFSTEAQTLPLCCDAGMILASNAAKCDTHSIHLPPESVAILRSST